MSMPSRASWPTTRRRKRMSLMSHQSDGPLVAMPKILRILARQDVRATFFVPGFTAECHPDIVRAIADGGHEIGHHGYLHEQMQGIDRAREARYLDRGLEALQRVAGVVPVGYRAPWWGLNCQSPGLLAERGFRYDSSLLDGDAPYRFAVEPGSADTLVEIPWTGPWTTGTVCVLSRLDRQWGDQEPEQSPRRGEAGGRRAARTGRPAGRRPRTTPSSRADPPGPSPRAADRRGQGARRHVGHHPWGRSPRMGPGYQRGQDPRPFRDVLSFPDAASSSATVSRSAAPDGRGRRPPWADATRRSAAPATGDCGRGCCVLLVPSLRPRYALVVPPSRAETSTAVSATLRARTSSIAGNDPETRGREHYRGDEDTAVVVHRRGDPTSSSEVRPSLRA